ncbi:outer membrane beta-barrel protein [Chitinophaga sp. YIM B06452]|uniref:outer membrane beta-barrel protein n=1 Tax=Chitinophaga sp. YIM B06452 TaxID=3082158 RepID=UPI0031FF29AE
MKQFIVMAFVCLTGIQFAGAQVKKGNILVGGSVGVSWSETEEPEAKASGTSYHFSPKVGYALTDKWVVGIYAAGNISKGKSDVFKSRQKSLTSGVFARNYHMLGDKVALFGEANAGYTKGSYRHNGVKTADFQNFTVDIEPGITWFAGKHLMVEGVFGGLSYLHQRWEDILANTKSRSNGLGLAFTREFELGVSFLF